jgi:hypothetical protein
MTVYPNPAQVGLLVQRIAAAASSPRFDILHVNMNTLLNVWERMEPEPKVLELVGTHSEPPSRAERRCEVPDKLVKVTFRGGTRDGQSKYYQESDLQNEIHDELADPRPGRETRWQVYRLTKHGGDWFYDFAGYSDTHPEDAGGIVEE